MLQVRNWNVSSCFEEFKTVITSNNFNEVIKKAGPPLMVKHDGKDIPTYVSYHLRGTCFKGFNQKVDQNPHSKDKDDALLCLVQEGLCLKTQWQKLPQLSFSHTII